MEVVTIEAVSDKFKNKYNSGSVLVGGKWLQVSSRLNIKDFQKDSQVTVETETNDKGYTSITDIVKDTVPEKPKKAAKAKESDAITQPTKVVSSYEDTKSRRILVQGITQAVIQSPMLAGLSFTNEAEAVEVVKTVSVALIAFVNEQSE